MPFEAFHIKGPSTDSETSVTTRSIVQVAAEIKDAYAKVEEMGGDVIAEHNIVYVGDRACGTRDIHWLVLVAKVEPVSGRGGGGSEM